MDLQSLAIYGALAPILFRLGKSARKRESRGTVWLMALLPSLVAGLRNVSVGIDTATYDAAFTLIERGQTEQVFGLERGFVGVCALLLRLWRSHGFLFFVFALASYGLLFFRLWQERGRLSFPWAALALYIGFYPFSLNGMRQFLAVALVVYATGYLREGKYLRFLLWVAAASLLHLSALVGLGYLGAELLFLKYFDPRRRRRVLLLCGAALAVGAVAFARLMDRYGGYLAARSSGVGLMLPGKLLLLLAAATALRRIRPEEEGYETRAWGLYYGLGLGLTSLGYFVRYGGRAGLYYSIFEVFFLGRVLRAENDSVWIVALKWLYGAMLGYQFYVSLTHGAQGEMPYRFFWQ